MIKISLPVMLISSILVIMLLEMSKFPGTLDDTQMGFSASIIKTHFSIMDTNGLNLFIIGNIIDYLFMIGYGLFFYSASRYLSLNYPQGSLMKRLGLLLSIAGLASAICDGLENVFLFSMIADPAGFPDWLAIAHSSFAVTKFILMYTLIGWLVISFLLNKTLWKSRLLEPEINA